jgi:hypothetical protein
VKLHVLGNTETIFRNECKHVFRAILEGGGASYAKAVSLATTLDI